MCIATMLAGHRRAIADGQAALLGYPSRSREAAQPLPMPELFRRQAVDYQRQKFHGAIVLTRSPWQTAIAAFFVLLVLALVVFACTQGFARKESVTGVLLPAAGVL